MGAVQPDARAALQRHFGFEGFLDGQEAVVDHVIAGEDIAVIMPTGAGKSLCYQLPALIRDGYSLVISPLISLMKDQVDALLERGIPAAFVNSTLSAGEQGEVLDRTRAGEIKLLYVAPERLRINSFRNLIRQSPPSLLIVDEAHCISSWGHDFRPDYARIGAFVDELGITQVCAFTATATPVVRDDILKQLHRPDMHVYVTGFTRPNLAFSIVNRNKNEEKLAFIRKKLADAKPTIIYASTRKSVDMLADQLGCIPYHAGMTDDERTASQDRFMNDPCPVVAATNAFGMGIDRSDVRRVIHFNIPGSLEAYYQEAGRAGRDGDEAECILLFSYQDRYIHEFLIEMSHPPEFVVYNTWQTLLGLARQHQNNHLEVSQAELAGMVTGAKGDQQISASLKILEKNGYLARGFRQQNRGLLKLNTSTEQLFQRFPRPDSQRAVFLHRIRDQFGDRLDDGVSCTYTELTAFSGLTPDQVKRVLRALNGYELAWAPPFTGRGVNLLRPQELTPEIDFSELNLDKQLETQRLEDMLAYPQTQRCRQQFIISYFGQDTTADWRCEMCDRCNRSAVQGEQREVTESEAGTIVTLLTCVNELQGRFGKHKVVKCVTGSKGTDVLDAGLHRYSTYGSLRGKSQPFVLKLIDALSNAGYLKPTGSPKYPCLGISKMGLDVIDSGEVAPLAMPDTGSGQRDSGRGRRKKEPASSSSPPASVAGGDSDLYERLRTVRNAVAKKRRLIPYQVFSNKTLEALAELAPVTAEEALTVKGIGPQKAKRMLPDFLDEIRLWREENQLTCQPPLQPEPEAEPEPDPDCSFDELGLFG
jgi:ATP-dependent DNA helicase RecQ